LSSITLASAIWLTYCTSVSRLRSICL